MCCEQIAAALTISKQYIVQRRSCSCIDLSRVERRETASDKRTPFQHTTRYASFQAIICHISCTPCHDTCSHRMPMAVVAEQRSTVYFRRMTFTVHLQYSVKVHSGLSELLESFRFLSGFPKARHARPDLPEATARWETCHALDECAVIHVVMHHLADTLRTHWPRLHHTRRSKRFHCH